VLNFSQRIALNQRFLEWAEKNGAAQTGENMVAFLAIKELINEDKAISYLNSKDAPAVSAAREDRREDQVEISISQLYNLLQEAAKADLFRNGMKNRIPYSNILCVIDGYDSTIFKLDNALIWHDVKTDPPKTSGFYFVKNDGANCMWLCNYRDGVWTSLCDSSEEAEITNWAELGE